MVGKAVVSIFSLILVVGVVIGIVAVVQRSGHSSEGDGGSNTSQQLSTSSRISKLCEPTDYKESCEKTLQGVGVSADPKKYVQQAILATVGAVQKSFNLSTDLLVQANGTDKDVQMSLEDCKDLLNDAIEELQASFSTLGGSNVQSMSERTEELQNWLSAVISYQETCLDQFGDPNSKYKKAMQDGMVDANQLTSNALAMVNALSNILSNFGLQINLPSNHKRRLLAADDKYPSWIDPATLQLLNSDPAAIKPNFTVAKDGSGDFTTVSEAVAKCPLKSNSSCIIYVKAGVYQEYVTVDRKQSNVFLYGDGPKKSVITGSHSNTTGWKTMRSATFAALGNGFTAKSMGFENTAGAEGHQAVALRVQADMASLFDCNIDGYQDTLYTQAHRQFYSNCAISGTIDFIFGDATVLIQDSIIVVRLPLPAQLNTVTAHGRADKHETTALVIKNCQIVADDKLYPTRTTVKSYLGRPWKAYSRALVMESEITDVIQPEGWLPWVGDLYLDTLDFAEYKNTGAGAATDKRVNWKGFHVITDPNKVQEYMTM